MSKFIVLFEVKPTKEGVKKYLALASELKSLLEDLKVLSVQSSLLV